MRDALRTRHYSPRTQEAYCNWVQRFTNFHDRRPPAELGRPEIEAFLTDLATTCHVSASTQNQALAALLFLYVHVLHHQLDKLGDFTRAKRPQRVLAVLTPTEVAAVFERMSSPPQLMASLLYGAGLRLLECCHLRVKDLDLERKKIFVRQGKGQKDRTTMLPQRLVAPLREHLLEVREQHQHDLRSGAGRVEMPDALDLKLPNAGREWP
jgi:site-specific recombinase XerD